MSIKCCVLNCKEALRSASGYRTHMGFAHFGESISVYPCTHEHCGNKFKNLKNLLKHLRNSHEFSEGPNDISNEQLSVADTGFDINIEPQINLQTQQEQQQQQQQQQQEEFLCVENDSCEIEIEEEILELLFEFLNSMHRKSNMTKKMSNEIFTSVNGLLNRVCDLFKICEKDKSILNRCYLNMSTQYRYEKLLKSKGMLTKGKKNYIYFSLEKFTFLIHFSNKRDRKLQNWKRNQKWNRCDWRDKGNCINHAYSSDAQTNFFTTEPSQRRLANYGGFFKVDRNIKFRQWKSLERNTQQLLR
jgi:hypothetical protein